MKKDEFFKIMDRGYPKSKYADRSVGAPELIVDFRSSSFVPEFEDENAEYPVNAAYPLYVEDRSDTVPDGSPLPFRYIIHIPDSWSNIPFLEELRRHGANDNLWMYL